MNCVIKTATDNKDVVWQAMYINGIKQIESRKLNIDIANEVFNNNETYKEIKIFENDIENIRNSFIDNEDFSYLLDNVDVCIDDYVYLENGRYQVTEVYSGYRDEGLYDYVEWIDGKPHKTKVRYESHSIVKIKVKDLKRTIVWEDYNYQQSNLYELFNKQQTN